MLGKGKLKLRCSAVCQNPAEFSKKTLHHAPSAVTVLNSALQCLRLQDLFHLRESEPLGLFMGVLPSPLFMSLSWQ